MDKRMTRDEDGNLIRDPANPHGLGPIPDPEEYARQLERLILARDSARAVLERIEEMRAGR